MNAVADEIAAHQQDARSHTKNTQQRERKQCEGLAGHHRYYTVNVTQTCPGLSWVEAGRRNRLTAPLRDFVVQAATGEAVSEARTEIGVSVLLFDDRPAQNVANLLCDTTPVVTRQVDQLVPDFIFQIIDHKLRHASLTILFLLVQGDIHPYVFRCLPSNFKGMTPRDFQASTNAFTTFGPCTPVTVVISISAVFDGPLMSVTPLPVPSAARRSKRSIRSGRMIFGSITAT